MTLPPERTRAVLQMEEAVRRVLRDGGDVNRHRQALAVALRHYPTRLDMERAAEQAPEIFGPPPPRADAW